MGIDLASVGRRGRNSHRQKMVEELRKRLGESLKVKTSNSEEVRLTYFPARGRAEISRLIFAHAGVKFDDIRLTGEDFAKVKPILPYGSMPILEYKGEVICESMAIAAFLADICNLAGTNAVEKAKANEIVLAMNGLFETIANILLVVLQDNLRSAVIGGGDVIEKFPKMCNLFQRVSCLPNIKAWRGSRPIDPMFNN